MTLVYKMDELTIEKQKCKYCEREYNKKLINGNPMRGENNVCAWCEVKYYKELKNENNK